MSHRLQVLVALFLGAAVGAGIVSCTQQPSSQATAAREPAAAPQWEYKVTNFDGSGGGGENLSKQFNTLATEGWEYNGAVGGGYVAFRRPKK